MGHTRQDDLLDVGNDVGPSFGSLRWHLGQSRSHIARFDLAENGELFDAFPVVGDPVDHFVAGHTELVIAHRRLVTHGPIVTEATTLGLGEMSERKMIDQESGRDWVSQPEVESQRVVDATGRGWDEWCDIVDDWPGHEQGHAAVAAWLESEHGVSAWWAQTITIGWERITGRRLPGEMPDGTFTANRSKTVVVDHAELRENLLDGDGREKLFPGRSTELRSKPSAKAIRIGFADTVATISLTSKGDGRVAVSVQHAKLAAPADIDLWKIYWDEFFASIDAS